MNILIYIPDINGQSWGGVRQYAVGLLKILALDYTNNYFVYHNASDSEIIDVLYKHPNLVLITDESVNYKPYRYPSIGKRGTNYILKRLKLSPLKEAKYLSHVELLCIKYSIQVIHCPYQFIPKVDNPSIRLITTLHDVQELHFPEFFTPYDRALRATRFLDYLERANTVVVSYNHVKDDLIKYFSLESSRIKVILLDMGKLWFDKFSSTDIVDLDKYNLPQKFIFYPANTWKHKNHIRLIEAIALVKSIYGFEINIVCSGHKNDYYFNVIEPKIKELKLENIINFIGIVEEKDLYNLYKHAIGVIIPTLYEAGSFPLMESIMLKIPVICSNITSLPETINNEKCLFNPFDVADIADKMKLLWISQDFRNEALRANDFSALRLQNTHALQRLMRMYIS